jgi:hypothetical protein
LRIEFPLFNNRLSFKSSKCLVCIFYLKDKIYLCPDGSSIGKAFL